MPKCLYNKQEMTAGEMFWELRVDGEVVTGLAEGSGPMKEMLKKIQVPWKSKAYFTEDFE